MTVYAPTDAWMITIKQTGSRPARITWAQLTDHVALEPGQVLVKKEQLYVQETIDPEDAE
jgi:hypothetical protein